MATTTAAATNAQYAIYTHIYTYNKNNNKITIITKRGNENNNKRKGKEQMFTCYKRGF